MNYLFNRGFIPCTSSKVAYFSVVSSLFSSETNDTEGEVYSSVGDGPITEIKEEIESTTDSLGGFDGAIPIDYIYSKDKALTVGFSIWGLLDKQVFCKSMVGCVRVDKIYNIYVRVRYNVDRYIMLGHQIGFTYQNLKSLENIHETIKDRVDDYFDDYNIKEEDVVHVQVSIRQVSIKLLSEFGLDKGSDVEDKQLKSVVRELNIPLSTNEEYLGKPLKVVTGEDNYIKDVRVHDENFIKLLMVNERGLMGRSKVRTPNANIQIKPANCRFKSSCKFYLVRDRVEYLLCLELIDHNTVRKIRYNPRGFLVSSVIDKKINDITIRTKGDKVYTFNGTVLVHLEQNIKLLPLPKPVSKDLFIPNTNLGVLDCETYIDKNGFTRVHAIGFFSKLDDSPVMYYTEKTSLNNNEIILVLINELLRSKYKGITFYCHNLRGFDIAFIIDAMSVYNDSVKNVEDEYKYRNVLRKDQMIKLVIYKGRNKVTIMDSYCMLDRSLKDLAETFQVDTKKGVFPYGFANYNTLFYKGKTPDISYYKDLSPADYNNLYKEEWSFKDETLAYLKDDLKSLYQIIVKANDQIFKDFNMEMSDSITISSLALKFFLKNYYVNNIPRIFRNSVYLDIKSAYYGGITEVYKPEGNNLKYYDVNSLYPYVGLQDMPGLECKKLNFCAGVEIGDLFGFFYCDVECSTNNYLGVLPVRDKSGLLFPVGKWSGWYFSEELKYAVDCGYKVKVLKGYSFSRESDIFKGFVNDVYKLKANPKNSVQKSLAKSVLNNLLGRFGIGLDKAITSVLDTATFAKKSTISKILNYYQLSNGKVLTTYIPKLDPVVIKNSGLDITKVLEKHKDNELQYIEQSSIVISAAVNAYGRIHISKIKQSVLDMKGMLYYSDTDSIVTNITLPDDMLSNKEIGKLKLEHSIQKGIFIGGKLYCLVTDSADKEVIIKAKGCKSSSLEYDDFVSLLNNVDVKAKKTTSKLDWSRKDVIFKDENIGIKSNSYTKRSKLFKDGKWVDTKPLVISTDENGGIVKNLNIDNNQKKNSLIYKLSVFSLFILCLLGYVFSYLFNSSDIEHNPLYEDKSYDILDQENDPYDYIELPTNPLDTNTFLNNYDSVDSSNSDNLEVVSNKEVDSPNSDNLEVVPNKEVDSPNSDNLEVVPNKEVDSPNSDNSKVVPNKEIEMEVLITMQNNYHASFLNSIIHLNPGAEVKIISDAQVNYLKDLLSKIEETNSSELLVSPTNTENSFTDSEIEFERLVREIRCGNTVSILSPLRTNSFDSNYESEENPSDSPAYSEPLPSFNPSTSSDTSGLRCGNTASDLYPLKTDSNYGIDKTGSDPSNDNKQIGLVKPNIIVITKRLNSDDPIPCLPSWIELSHSHVDYHIKEARLRQMYLGDFTNSHGIPKSTSNSDWMESSQSYNIDTLFNDKSYLKANNDKFNSNDESYDLDRLFNEAPSSNDTPPSNTMEREDSSWNSLLELYKTPSDTSLDSDAKTSSQKDDELDK